MKKENFYLKLGKRIKEVREERDFSLGDIVDSVSEKTDIKLSKGSLSAIENKGRPVSSYLLFCIAEALSASVQDFFIGNDFSDNSSTNKISKDSLKLIKNL